MSAKIVSHDHIDAMLTYAIGAGLAFELVPGIALPFTAEAATQLGQILLLANVQAAMAEAPEAAPPVIYADSYLYRPVAEPITPAMAARMADTLDHLCCSDTRSWDETLPQRICWAARPLGALGADYDAGPAHFHRGTRAA